MKFVLYGLPCAGKTTLFKALDIPVIHGSSELNKLAGGRFSELPADEKNRIRIEYAQQLAARTDSFISDGHYSFHNEVVFTEADAALYDVFIYLYCEPETLRERMQVSGKNARFAALSTEHIAHWQNSEIEALRRECHNRNKNLYVVQDITSSQLQEFISKIENGFSSYALAEKIAYHIRKSFPAPCELHICDGDKTLIRQDSFRVCTGNHITHAFDNDFYTGYQALRFSEETAELTYDLNKPDTIELNPNIFSKLRNNNYVVLSSGITQIWEALAARFNLQNVIADPLISADTKFFVVKLLQEYGYTVCAYGDSKNDLYMLKKANKGYLFIGEYLSRSLKNADTSGLQLLYDRTPYILSEVCGDIKTDITICTSSSGINGAKLADAHLRLGKRLGEVIRRVLPNDNAAVITLERGGRFFGDGLYTGFGGTFYSVDPKSDIIPELPHSVIIVADSVINTGRSMLNILDELSKSNPESELCIAANVIQKDALKLLCDYKIFAVRTSANSFVGANQSTQKNGKGPDTADRLFNYIRS